MANALPSIEGVSGPVQAVPVVAVDALGGIGGSGAFDVAVQPTVTAGAYSAGDIMGGLLTFADVAPVAGGKVIIAGAQVVSKAAVTPNLTLILFNADPSGTTKTDNAPYALATTDAFKLIAAIPLASLYDHGTPNSWRADGINIVAACVARALYGLLVDATGVTLASTSDIQVRLRGIGA